jgi:hypothetical protein
VLCDTFDDLEEFVDPITMSTRQADEISRLRDDGSVRRRSRNGHSTPATELEQTFVPERP